jgi:RNA polymerase sigma-70 factor (ECF subfamily)
VSLEATEASAVRASASVETVAGTELRATDEGVQLMLAFRAGDDRAFDALFDRWGGPLLHYLERMVGDTATAEELVQESFLRVYRARERYTPTARFSTWLFRIATNLALNELRRPQRQHDHASDDETGEGPGELRSPAPTSDELVHAGQLAAAVERALGALPGRQRMALWLVAVEGFSYAEVAATLESTEKSVKALVHRARVAVGERMAASAAAGERKDR